MKKFIEDLHDQHNKIKCPACGSSEWATFPQKVSLPVPEVSGDLGAGIKFCSKCGFIAMFANINK